MSESIAVIDAYNAMSFTKLRHLKVLQAKSNRVGSAIPPIDNEAELLTRLLDDHDQAVLRFKDACNALAAADSQALTATINALSELERMLEPYMEENPS